MFYLFFIILKCHIVVILPSSIQVKEHMEIFAVLKGVEDRCFEQTVTEMVEEVSLFSKYLSAVLVLLIC